MKIRLKKKKKIQLFKPEATFLEVKMGKVTFFFVFPNKRQPDIKITELLKN